MWWGRSSGYFIAAARCVHAAILYFSHLLELHLYVDCSEVGKEHLQDPGVQPHLPVWHVELI
jgi:hypothetical protein